MITGVIAETGSLYLFLLFGSRCFVNFQVNDTIAVALNGNAINLVKPLGWVGIAMFVYGCIVLLLLGRWISWNMHKVPPPESETTTLTTSSKPPDGDATPVVAMDDDDLGSLYSGRYSRCFGACCWSTLLNFSKYFWIVVCGVFITYNICTFEMQQQMNSRNTGDCFWYSEFLESFLLFFN